MEVICVRDAKDKLRKYSDEWGLNYPENEEIRDKTTFEIIEGILDQQEPYISKERVGLSDRYEGVLKFVSERLKKGGCLKEGVDSESWCEEIEVNTSAIKRYQNLFGLIPDAIIGYQTMAALIQNGLVYKEHKTFTKYKKIKEAIQKKKKLDGSKAVFHENPGSVNLYGIRTVNREDEWNDVIGVAWIPSVGGVERLTEFIGSADPGRYYQINPVNRRGCAYLEPGQYHAWQVGVHKPGSRSGHTALCQTAGQVKVKRVKPNGETSFDVGHFGINIHWGYGYGTVYISSAGCQVIRMWSDFSDFMKIVKSDTQYQNHHGYVFNYTLLEENDIL